MPSESIGAFTLTLTSGNSVKQEKLSSFREILLSLKQLSCPLYSKNVTVIVLLGVISVKSSTLRRSHVEPKDFYLLQYAIILIQNDLALIVSITYCTDLLRFNFRV